MGYPHIWMLVVGDSFTASYPATAESVPLARADVTAFAEQAGVEAEELDSIRLAVSEAVANAVLHAYEQPNGSIQVSVNYLPGELWLFVGDSGSGFRVRHNSRGLGLGLALIARLADDFEILSRGTGGTELRMQFKLEELAQASDQDWRGSVASAASPA
jgi:anti-sigma regulatory factor (Ser/Thr protein kinase)